MSQIKTVAGQDLRDMFAAATSWLEKSSADIDALNVFPVPDGDTGTNMMLTMRSTMEAAYRAPDHSAAGVAHAMARGALMGARGNSGVILSQIWRGLAEELEGKESFNAADLAEADDDGAGWPGRRLRGDEDFPGAEAAVELLLQEREGRADGGEGRAELVGHVGGDLLLGVGLRGSLGLRSGNRLGRAVDQVFPFRLDLRLGAHHLLHPEYGIWRLRPCYAIVK